MLVAVEQYGAEQRSAARRLAGWASLLRWAEPAAQIRPQVLATVSWGDVRPAELSVFGLAQGRHGIIVIHSKSL